MKKAALIVLLFLLCLSGTVEVTAKDKEGKLLGDLNETPEKLQTFVSGPNCCQAVISAYAEEYGIAPGQAGKIGLGFGGGIALTRNICGAATGMVMVLGLKFADKMDKFAFYEMIRQALKEFENRAVNLNCGELTGSGYGERLPPEHKKTCSKYIRIACDIIDDVEILPVGD